MNLCTQHHAASSLGRSLSISAVAYLHSSGSVLADSCVKGCTACTHTFVRIPYNVLCATSAPVPALAPSTSNLSPPRAQPAHSTSTGAQHPAPATCLHHVHSQLTTPAPAPAHSTQHQHRHQQPVSTVCTASSQHQHQHRRPAPATCLESAHGHFIVI